MIEYISHFTQSEAVIVNRKLFFSAISVMLLALFAFVSSGGCGGSDNLASINPQIPDTPSTPDTPTDPDIPSVVEAIIGSEVTLGLDSNTNNKPDIFDFDGIRQLHSSSSGTELRATVPFMFWMESLPSPYSPYIITTELAAETDYTFEVSRNLADSLGARIPDIEIFDPSGKKVNPVLTVYPKEQPAMILFTFTPSVSGTYTVKICNADGNAEGDTDCVLFAYKEMHNSKGENGYYSRFTISDKDGSTIAEVSVPEIIQLRKMFLKSYPDYLDKVYSENPEQVDFLKDNLEEYYAWMAILESYAGIVPTTSDDLYEDEELSDSEYSDEVNAAASLGVTQIDTTVYNVPYVNEYKLGTGLMATTNLQPLSESGLEPFTLNVPSDKRAGATRFTYSFISSKEDYEQKMERNFKMGLATSALGVSAGVQSTNNLKFGLTSTTLVIHYEELEATYRDLPLNQYKLTEDALQTLSDDGSAAFRQEYGDYFVAGYQYGGMYEAHIAITTETTEQLEKVKSQFGASLNTMGASLSGDQGSGVSAELNFSKTTQETLTQNKAEICVEIKTIGAGKTSPTNIPLANSRDISAMGNVAEELMKFKNSMAESFSANTYVPVNVEFKRYRSLPGMRRRINAYIPVPSEHSSNIMSFNSEVVALRGYHSAISTLPASKMDTLSRDEYTRKFNAIVNPIKTGGNAFYENADQMAQTLPKVIDLSRELKIVGDRLSFYNMLVNAQEKELSRSGTTIPVANQPFNGVNGGCTGYKSFGLSTAVMKDLENGEDKSESYTAGEKLFTTNTWTPSYDAGKDYRYSWFQVTATNPNDSGRKVSNPPAVGKQKASFSFESGGTRTANWTIERQSIYMPRSLYPFFGLKD